MKPISVRMNGLGGSVTINYDCNGCVKHHLALPFTKQPNRPCQPCHSGGICRCWLQPCTVSQGNGANAWHACSKLCSVLQDIETAASSNKANFGRAVPNSKRRNEIKARKQIA